MKKGTILGVLIGMLFLSASVYAQQGSQNVDEMVSKMQSQLNLTPDQVNAIKPIIQDTMAKRQALRDSMKGGSGDKDSVHSQMQQLKEEESQKLSGILSADQMSQWQNMQNHMHHSKA